MDQNPPLTVDQVIQRRRALTPDEPIIAYPSSGIEYVDYTIIQLDSYAYNAARHYAELVPQRSSSVETPRVVGLLGLSNLDYVVSILALIKLGHTVLFLSPRISRDAYVSLLQATGCRAVLASEQSRRVVEDLRDSHFADLQVYDFAGVSQYDQALDPGQSTRMDLHLDLDQENKYVNWIIHSSGSTSLPRPVYLTHRALINNWKAHNFNMKAYITAPLYHSHGVGSLFKTFYTGKQAHLYNADLPMASKYLTGTLKEHTFEIVHIVPYSLKLLVESDEAVDLLAACRTVMFGGSACPDALGDHLVSRGVNLVSHYGTTETGQLMSSERPRGDLLWNYLRPSDITRPFLQFEDRGQGLLELVCLADWRGKVVSNREDGSYATKDLFTKHPTMEAYKYFSRLDDTIVLVNGEKANPLIIENAVRRQPEVREVVAFGHGKSRLGLMIIPTTDITIENEAERVLERVWPTISEAQIDMPDYAQLTKEMITILPANTEYPMTDKRTLIRQAFYKKFAAQIEEAYERAEKNQGSLDLSQPELEDFILTEVQKVTQSSSVDATTDFFSLGMDSLQATQLRSILVSRINLRGNVLGLNIVFDYPNTEALANKIHSFQTETSTTELSVEEEMNHYINKYGKFEDASSSTAVSQEGELPQEQYILLTGATGSLGAHILAKLLSQDRVKMVLCPVRAATVEAGKDRVFKSLRSRMVYDDIDSRSFEKIRVLIGDLPGPGQDIHQEMIDKLTAVVHCAWSVNFNLRLRSFEKDCIAGARQLIDLCLLSAQGGKRRPATFNFCSSVSTAEETRDPIIKETLPPDFSYARHTGYAQSKLVTEHICFRAVNQTGLTCRVLRVGQLIGDTRHGIWNENEAFPLIWQSARTIGALPQIPETPRWLPVDVAAEVIIDISLSGDAPAEVYNVTNHRTFDWTRDLLPKLRASALGDFEACHPREWVQRLRDSRPDPVANPPYKLLEFFAMRYGYEGEARLTANWATDRAQKHSEALRNAPVIDQDLVDRVILYFTTNCWAATAMVKV